MLSKKPAFIGKVSENWLAFWVFDISLKLHSAAKVGVQLINYICKQIS